jgi:pSer/pThr/pTyr-binding forkhead associated (FHA) protein
VLSRLGGSARGAPTADTGGRLEGDDGKLYEIPPRGITIGRDPSCDVVLADPEVSRRHATIAPSLQGYMLTDVSANGTHVNGVRVDGTVLLGLHDVVRLGDTELRFSADAANLDPEQPPEEGRAPAAAAPAGARATTAPRPGLLATLEVLSSGTLRGKRFRIERPVVHVGRGGHNDVRLDDSGVSSSHATITRRGAAWEVHDLGSTNGTYVDGERVTERVLRGSAELRFGTMKLLFRPIGGGGDKRASTRAIVGLRDDEL